MSASADAPTLIVIGGVPGAGKSTAIETVLAGRATGDVRALDSDQVRRRLAARVPAGTPYGSYRPLVHLLHMARVLGWLLLGPHRAGVRLIVHDPCTRLRRLHLLTRFARRHGWTPALVLVDAERHEARAGQRSRGRVLDGDNFDRHWRRWSDIRQKHTDLPGWESIDLVTRAHAARVLAARVDGRPEVVTDTLVPVSVGGVSQWCQSGVSVSGVSRIRLVT